MTRLSILTSILAISLAAACPAARDVGIHAMLVGDKVLELSDNKQLTLRADGKVTDPLISPDGKYVVYTVEKPDALECRLTKISTGKTATIMSRTPYDDQRPATNELWSLDDLNGIAWSPDSSMFAFGATHKTWEADKMTEQQFIVVFSASGAFKKSLLIRSPREEGDTCAIPENLLFTPDSRQILAHLLVPDLAISEKHHPLNRVVRLIDISTGAQRNVGGTPKSSTAAADTEPVWSKPMHIVGWSDDACLLYQNHDQTGELHKMALDGSSDQVLLKKSWPNEVWSPDGKFAATENQGLSIRGIGDPTATRLIDSAEAHFAAWSPNGRMILYAKNESISDVPKQRKQDFQSLWLSAIVPGKQTSLLVVLDSDESPSCSRDCRAVAYTSQGQIYVGELILRDPNVNEKLAAGLPLTEEETKRVLMQNAKEIGRGILMYSADYDGKLPPADSVADALRGYLQNGDAFYRPGSRENIFHYLGSGFTKADEIKSPTDTALGELDAGYGWKAVLYADGHVQLVQKQ